MTGFNRESSNKKSNSKTSVDLAYKIIEKNDEAKNQFVLINYNWLLFIVRRKFSRSNNHEDIVQDAFMIVINNLEQGKVSNPRVILSYLRTTALNIGFEYLRQDKKFKSSIDHDLLEEIESSKEDILTTIIWNDKTKYVKQVITELKVQRDQDILYGFYFLDKSKVSICQQLELSSEHFDRVLYRAKQRLKQLIQQKDDNNKPNHHLEILKDNSAKSKSQPDKFMMKILNFKEFILKFFKSNPSGVTT